MMRAQCDTRFAAVRPGRVVFCLIPKTSAISACSHPLIQPQPLNEINQQLSLLREPQRTSRVGSVPFSQYTTSRQAVPVLLSLRMPTAPSDLMPHTDSVGAVPELYRRPVHQKSPAKNPCAICFDLDIEANNLPGQRAGRGLKLCKVSELRASANSCRGCWLLAIGLARASGSA